MNRRALTKTILTTLASGAIAARSATAQTPVASPVTGAITKADVPGASLTLSPDGTRIASVVEREMIAVWDATTFELITQSDPLQEIAILDDVSLTWSPQSDALAWSLNAARLLRDSDIYIFDVTSATITNLTPEDGEAEDAPSLLDSTGIEFGVDMFPSWSATGDEILFARSPFGNDAPRETHIMRISRDGGEATEIARLSRENVFLVSGPMTVFEDGSVLYGTWPPGPDDPDDGVFLVTPDMEVEGISTGILAQATPAMRIYDVARDANKASAVSIWNYSLFDDDSPIWIELDLRTGIPTAFEEILSLPRGNNAREQDLVLFAAPAFLTGNDGEVSGYLYATADADFDNFTFWQHDVASGDAAQLGSVENPGPAAPGLTQIPHMVVTDDGTAALFFAGNLWMIDLG